MILVLYLWFWKKNILHFNYNWDKVKIALVEVVAELVSCKFYKNLYKNYLNILVITLLLVWVILKRLVKVLYQITKYQQLILYLQIRRNLGRFWIVLIKTFLLLKRVSLILILLLKKLIKRLKEFQLLLLISIINNTLKTKVLWCKNFHKI